MQPKTLTFDETMPANPGFSKRKTIKVEPIEGGLILSASCALLQEWSSGAHFHPRAEFSETFDVAEAQALIKALTDAVDEVTRPVSEDVLPVVSKHTVLAVRFSNGQWLESYFEADGLSFEEEARQVATIGFDGMKAELVPQKIGEREAKMRAEFEKAFPRDTPR